MPPEFEKIIRDIKRELEDRVEQAEEKLAAAEREIERKDQIIAALQKRLFGSQSERIDPDQYQLEFGEEVLGKPEPPTPCESEGDPEADGGERRNAEPNNPLVIRASESPCQSITPSARVPRTKTCDTQPFTLMSSVC